MSRAGYTWIGAAPEETVTVTVDGQPRRLPAHRSLLAGLLSAGDATQVEHFCAIGQCQRCLVRVNGAERLACLTAPAADDAIETPAHRGGGRPGGGQ